MLRFFVNYGKRSSIVSGYWYALTRKNKSNVYLGDAQLSPNVPRSCRSRQIKAEEFHQVKIIFISQLIPSQLTRKSFCLRNSSFVPMSDGLQTNLYQLAACTRLLWGHHNNLANDASTYTVYKIFSHLLNEDLYSGTEICAFFTI